MLAVVSLSCLPPHTGCYGRAGSKTSPDPARVLERHACVYGGRRFAHVVLRYGGKLVSVMVTAADTRHPAAVAPSVIDGMKVTSFVAGHQVVFVAGDISTTDLQALTDTIAAPLTQVLAAI
jgi:hypothetical protein